jgi:hypothetical protein
LALASALVLLALANHLDLWKSWVVAGIAGLAAAGMPIAVSTPSTEGTADTASIQRLSPLSVVRIIGLATLATVLAAVLIDRYATGHAVASVADSRGVLLTIAGGLAAIFVGGEVIARALHPFAVRLGDRAAGMENAGRVIGWLERALLYALVLAGAPDAAALIVAGKSIARFSSFSSESFAEYYLIGSLMSLITAAGIAIAVRGALGLSLLPSAGA